MERSFYRNPRNYTLLLIRRAIIASIFYYLLIRYSRSLIRGDSAFIVYFLAAFAFAFTCGIISTTIILSRTRRPAVTIAADGIFVQQLFKQSNIAWKNIVDTSYYPVKHVRWYRHAEDGRKHAYYGISLLPGLGDDVGISDLDRFTEPADAIGKALDSAVDAHRVEASKVEFDREEYFRGYDENKLRGSLRRQQGGGTYRVGVPIIDNDDTVRYIATRMPRVDIRDIIRCTNSIFEYQTNSDVDHSDTEAMLRYILQHQPELSHDTAKRICELYDEALDFMFARI